VLQQIDTLDKKITRQVTTVPQMMITYAPVRDFWLTNFGVTQMVSIERLSMALQAHLNNGEY
jgi:hypothetical protein